MRISTRIMHIRRRTLVIVVIALTMVATACSSESGDSNAPANETSFPATEPDGSETQGENFTSPADEPPTPANEATANPVDMAAVEVATSFLEAYGAFDVERAITYLADDADILAMVGSVGAQGVTGTLEEFRLLLSLLEAQGYKQMLHSCEEWGASASGTNLRCTFDFHAIRSDEIGLGPYSGSYFRLDVRDGEIARASLYWQISEFSPQMWEPFAEWVSTTYPEDGAVMYNSTYTDFRLSEESIRLWEQRSREYVEEVGRSSEGAETTP